MRIIVTVLSAICLILSCNAQSLQDKELLKLTESVRMRYATTMMEGSSVYKTKQGNVLVTLVSVKKSPYMQRVAQVKAARDAGEFLQSAVNKSVTTYGTIDNSSYSMADKAEENSKNHNSKASSSINQNVSDSNIKQSEESFSDKIIQSSLTRVGHMSPLTRFVGEEGVQMFAFYLILQ